MISSETKWESYSVGCFQTRLTSAIVNARLRSKLMFVNTFLFVKS